MTTEREFREWQNKQQRLKKRQEKKSNSFLLLSTFIIIISIFLTVKNNPKLLENLNNQQLNNFLNLLNIKVNSLKSLTERFVTDIDETIIPTESDNFNQYDFSAIDKKALSINYSGNSVTELANILSQYANTDLEKARLIYSWITNNISYDSFALLAIRSGAYPDVTSEAVLNTRQTICSGYANLYQKLADAMGLKSVIVLGYGKGVDYIVGEDEKVNHAWNAVKIEEKWYLIDSTWGAGTVENSTFNKQFNPYYFASNPSEFIYSHFPENEKWQLLTQPYARETFNNLPDVSADLFKNQIQLVSHKTNTIYADNRINITLQSPENIVATAKIKSGDNPIGDNYTFVQNKDGYININAAFPSKGNYQLDIFAKKPDNSNYYPHIVTYKVIANNPSVEFPLTYRDFHQNNGYLETPLTKSLLPNQLNYFKLSIDNATEVKVLDKSTNNWSDLVKYGNLYAGSVRVSNGAVIVFAKFPGDSRYWALLEYN